MKKRILAYLAQIDALLADPPAGTDWKREREKHLIQIGFFMHERLVHLIVTVVFAILTVGCMLYAVAAPGLGMLLLIAAFLCLLVPYIAHYFLLENGVQKMYRQYDRMLELEEAGQREKAACGDVKYNEKT